MEQPVSHVVVVGAGFAGLSAARRLVRVARRTPLRVTLVDRHNYHTFQPLLYQVATSGLSPQDVGHSIRSIFGLRGRPRRRAATIDLARVDDATHRTAGRPVDFRMGTVVDVDLGAQRIGFADGGALPYDQLVLAAGAVTNDFGIPGVAAHGFEMKSIAHATTLRNHVLGRFEDAGADPSGIVEGDLTFVVAGAGPTGVELAGALAELRDVLRRDHPPEAVARTRIVLVEMEQQVLPAYRAGSADYTRAALEARGVEVRLGTTIERVDEDHVELTAGGGDEQRIPTRMLIWTAGVRANPLGEVLGVELIKGGRVPVGPDLRLAEHPEVMVIGDLAAATERADGPHPQLAPVAIQQGKHAAAEVERTIRGQAGRPFHYVDKGTMATIGRNDAVAELPLGLRLTGFTAWLAWLFLHLMYLVGFRNRVAVFFTWLWNYVSWDRASRLIIDQTEQEPAAPPASARSSVAD